MADGQRPSIGRIVLYEPGLSDPAYGEHVAVITAVHDDGSVNLRVLPDGPVPTLWRPRIKQGPPGSFNTWRWPDRA